MHKIKLSFSIITFLTFTFYAQAQEKVVDQFKISKNKVKVIFYDPLLVIIKTADFKTESDKEKSDLLDNHLHNNPLYLFSFTDSKTKEITYFCIRGNPEKVSTKMFYKVDVIRGSTGDNFNPNTDIYSDKVVKVIDKVNCGGTLFENMELFSTAENQKYIGNGIQVFGYFRRVQPYSEIKISMTAIIEQFEKEG